MMPYRTSPMIFSLKLLRRLNNLKQPLLLLPLIISILMVSGCSLTNSWFNAGFSPAPLNLTLQQVQATTKPGGYTIKGETSLPEGSKITVSAVRYLSGVQLVADSTSDRPYGILDRQIVVVNQGAWQATLNIWQTAADGRYQEPWQLTQTDSGAVFEPDDSITFMATFDPVNQPQDFKVQVEEQDEALQASLARFTTDGELYLQASKALVIALPTGKTAAPAKSRFDDAVRQSKRSNIKNSPGSQVNGSSRPRDSSQQPANWTTTTAPLSSRELMR